MQSLLCFGSVMMRHFPLGLRSRRVHVLQQAANGRADGARSFIRWSSSASTHGCATVSEWYRRVGAGECVESEAIVRGWVRSVREMKRVVFVEVNDGSTPHSIQLVIEKAGDAGAETAIQARDVSVGASIEARGVVKAHTPRGKECAVPELHVQDVLHVGACDVRARSSMFGSVLRLRHHAALAIDQFMAEREFIRIHSPIITTNDCEGAGETFIVTTAEEREKASKKAVEVGSGRTGAVAGIDECSTSAAPSRFFGKEAYLTVSGQLHAEMFACALSRVYTFGPTFRAEKSDTRTHLSEFWMVEPEIAFADVDDAMNLAEDMTRSVVAHVLEHCTADLDALHSREDRGLDDLEMENLLQTMISPTPYRRVTYSDAVALVQRSSHPLASCGTLEWGADLSKAHEQYLASHAFDTPAPVFITDFPEGMKPFYARVDDDVSGKGEETRSTAKSFDMIVPGVGELIGGTEREFDLDRLEERIARKEVDASRLQWYLDLRRYGTVRHAGFGMGFERLVQFLGNISNIRDTVPVPRAYGQCAM